MTTLTRKVARQIIAEQGTSVVVPGHYTSIGKNAFRRGKLRSIILPSGITTIKDGAFQFNDLKKIDIPKSVEKIGESSFARNRLNKIIIPFGLSSIRESAFEGNGLKSVKIPDSVTSIGDFAFKHNRLTALTLPSGVTRIGRAAFSDNKLKKIDLSHGLTTIGDGAFRENQLTKISIPNGVVNIGGGAFFDNKIKNVFIPNSVLFVGTGAFDRNDVKSISIPLSRDFYNYPGILRWYRGFLPKPKTRRDDLITYRDSDNNGLVDHSLDVLLFVDEHKRIRVHGSFGSIEQWTEETPWVNWAAVNAKKSGSNYDILMQGMGKPFEGKYRILTTDSDGLISSKTSWKNEGWFERKGLSDLFPGNETLLSDAAF